MDVIYTILLALGAFLLGACPFSVILGRLFLKKDIRDFGDGNPGAANVFRAGGHKLGYLAVFMDLVKGVPFVLLAHTAAGLIGLAIVPIAICAILGHAFSPFLQWRGGKAIAVTFGVLLALPQHEALLAFIVLVVIGALMLDNDSWGMMLGAAGTLAFLAITEASSWKLLIMLGVSIIFSLKHFQDLRTFPGFRGRLVRWIQSVIRSATAIN
ncbi:MAG: glycerol-3-phosphate acyltransferase [Dehalococcoidia bacterium]|jgi:glycerol-3-phosphate acyltransferase PlsY